MEEVVGDALLSVRIPLKPLALTPSHMSLTQVCICVSVSLVTHNRAVTPSRFQTVPSTYITAVVTYVKHCYVNTVNILEASTNGMHSALP